MDLVILISLVNAGMLAIAILGCLMFIITPAYRGVCVLLGLVGAAALANILEDLHISRELHLISPVFVLGYGPALYVAVRRLIVGPVGYQAGWHFLPILLVLPFTAYTQDIIAVGTLWRIVYALLTLKLILTFNKQLVGQRSDAAEVSLAWLGWLIVVSTFFSSLDLVRLNFQPELGEQLNMMGYAASCVVFFSVLLTLILILNSRRAALETVAGSAISELLVANPAVNPAANMDKKIEESAADYQELFAILEREIREQRWYCQLRLTLNQLSDLSGMSSRDISRCINLVAGMSFNDYINLHRIEHIKSALQSDIANSINANKINASSNLTDLAFAAGFSSKATFNQSFKKVTGMTPSEFRNQQHVQNHASSRAIAGD